MNESNNAAEREKMEVEDLASMLCASISAQMLITMEHDKIKVEGGTALYIVDMYMMAEFGVPSIAALPEGSRADFAARLRAMGGQI